MNPPSIKVPSFIALAIVMAFSPAAPVPATPALAAARAVQSEPVKIVGRAFVIDGDTLVVNRTHIRLLAIDAPEKDQTCAKPGQPKWACGAVATKVLRGKIGNRQVECNGEQWDSHGRLLAHCSLEQLDLNQWMVANGWATAYRYFSQEYAREEDLARSNQLGIWSSQFISPYEWRKLYR
ncbi:MAG: thermonuclease family protein [Alphaproteobacteria bacterium]|nr:thermonuclease family protein [Alphaproteobacteria bacterium]